MPVEGATISFSRGKGPVATGTTDETGRYHMARDGGKKGIPAGQYRVSVKGEGVPEKFADAEQSVLTVNIVGGDSNEFDFSLTR